MELKIGEIFNFHRIILQVCEVKDSARCKGCFFKDYPLSLCPPYTCVAIGRKDRKDIIFKKLINKMTREKVKELLPIMQAFVEGKQIQDKIDGLTGWVDTNGIILEFNGKKIQHRIKPGPEYRPFKNQEECWQEMQKHHPFGWIKDNEDGHYTMVTMVDDAVIRINGNNDWFLDEITNNYTFADGTPFGIIEE